MARRTIVLCLILGLLAAANAVPFDFYYLILTWPGSVCASPSTCCAPKYGYPAEDFLIESFQTFDLSINKPVVRCRNGNPFDIKKLDPIENSINHYWSNMECPPTDGVDTCKSAWNSYGVCSGLSQLDYFKAALNLRKQADVLGALAEQGIRPVFDLYSTEKIKWAVGQKLGVTPGLQCNGGPFGKKKLVQVYLCVDTDAKTFIECPKLPAESCPESIIFESFHNWMLNTTGTAAFDSKILLPTESTLK